MFDKQSNSPQWLEELHLRTINLYEKQQDNSICSGDRPEALAGLTAQKDGLELLRRNFSLEWTTWNQLRDLYSLHPENTGFKNGFRSMATTWLGESVIEELRYFQCDVVLHLGCQKRLSRAMDSVHSFHQHVNHASKHVVVIGGSKRVALKRLPEMDSWLLELPVGDHYEDLHDKLFTAVSLLWLLITPAQIIKVDDDLHLVNQECFMETLEDLRTRGIAYAGRAISSHHRNLRHGWHIGKCYEHDLERLGYQYPLPRSYAAGGSGYVLGEEAIAEIGYAHLAMRQFFAMPCVGLEDGLVGLILLAAGINLYPLNCPVLPGLAVQ